MVVTARPDLEARGIDRLFQLLRLIAFDHGSVATELADEAQQAVRRVDDVQARGDPIGLGAADTAAVPRDGILDPRVDLELAEPPGAADSGGSLAHELCRLRRQLVGLAVYLGVSLRAGGDESRRGLM